MSVHFHVAGKTAHAGTIVPMERLWLESIHLDLCEPETLLRSCMSVLCRHSCILVRTLAVQ